MRALGFKRIGQFDLTALDTSGDPPPDVLLPDAPLGDVIVPPGLTIPTVPGGAGTPGPTSFRPGNWDQTASPAEYVIAQGDTMVGIAALYLGDGSRWTEIRDIQVNNDGTLGPNGPYLNHYNSKWYPGSTAPGSYFRQGAVLLMPPEALAKAKQLMGTSTPKAPPTPGAPANKPPGFAPAALGSGPLGSLGKGTKAVLAFGAVALIGGAIVWAVT